MPNTVANDFQVVVVGFGPSGAVATSLLGDRGLRTLTIDRQRGVYDKPRAIAIDHEILRLLDNLGAADKVRPYIAPFPASQHFGARGQLIRRIDMVAEPYPLGYTPSMVFTQPPVEAALRAHAQAYPGVSVELGTELVGFTDTGDGVMLHLRDDGGTIRTVTADYVIACDGASSGVRQQLGIAFDDLVFDEPWLVVDLQVEDAALDRLPETAAQFCDPARPTTFIIGPGRHRRFEIMLMPGEDPRAMEQPDRVWQLLAKWLTPAHATLWRAASYRFHALVATDWRRGRVLLAGDAAHQQPPFIGQGMCQGIRDVANLVWKLDRVLRGQSSAALLDTYGEERGAHVRELTGRIKAIGHVICERDPVAAEARDARILAEGGGVPRTITRQDIVPPLTHGLLAGAAHAANGTLFPQPWIRTPAGRQLLDAVSGAGWRLVLDGRNARLASPAPDDRAGAAGLRVIRIGGSDDSALTETDGVIATWFDRHGCAAAIVRPDHYVFGVAGDAPALAALMTELTTRLQ
ncbi:bifunctional 3-(3-hydroxy-phenyl)propionate/3-hydroxycinnamic acid hydroxylase [Bradyrhizobium sp. U87765 SZCCT0131]|uniref:bifunctional 3-(3-hydroxy-phenyl)propionate/3-hydroxycinnamic acid hydroxylase MhpA n=1 Tax=unclassified Bradyrhizobium TaxID=2631580 RepID=UPI001BA8FEC6|nr:MULTISPECIES: bifunctional 3-(3-hydroxy-phenyl)propionate/3-hydroxycinnamic acid hydroxylase [unclassified Bradyrhizobium]MBR1219494.1 bifunctional 3-(3-hydroxy-phenyl)propionate/3-hydroxycinnamic acid hydroxylase [Bradyrhizobium sp. U87765 SZCCT0131]MBR1262145.1 bifunctional 3-(3-hydroxy-phenyl)propionate/3-hydroxycinnamic acid hydroxylase [Bradyrhizobium sp. U87765 SZCCT0134]MBR1308672.1 bifunctional 3-(3-hydroxy-phenyl)propionate/3-hydroxycinnamic acid hydroxylase [Bradyrhizobium sp. U8776